MIEVREHMRLRASRLQHSTFLLPQRRHVRVAPTP